MRDRLACWRHRQKKRFSWSRRRVGQSRGIVTQLSAQMKAFKSIREQEYAVDNEETELGARCVAAPILNYQGRPIAAISISGPISYMTGSLVEQIARTLMEAT